MEQMEQLASEFGGSLKPARLPGKYSLVEKVFGLAAAKGVQRGYNRYKGGMLSKWDEVVSSLVPGSRIPR